MADYAPNNAMCSAVCKNGQPCACKARRMLNNSPVCMRHYKVEDDCSICLQKMSGGTMLLECGHTFHKGCLETWAQQQQQNETCPLCRKPLEPRALVQLNRHYIGMMTYMLFSLEPGRRNIVIGAMDDMIIAEYMQAPRR
jgi:hypothetical protein